jgi:hypothetical protein
VLHLQGPIFRPFRFTVSPVTARAYGKSGKGSGSAPSRTEALKEGSGFHALLQRLSGMRERVQGRHARGHFHPYAGNGYHHQADELMACVRAGRSESAVMPLAESVAVMQTVEAIRRAAGISANASAATSSRR